MENRFKPGDIVQHFKRETLDAEAFAQNKYLYRIIGIATQSETGEPMMVYQSLYDKQDMYVRPLEMFLGEVDHEKYPGIKQKNRFEKVTDDKSHEELREKLRKQVVSQFAGITVDMDYLLCVPSVHAVYHGEELVVDYGGKVREVTDAFPSEKIDLVIRWISLHRDEIVKNHLLIGEGTGPLIMIPPLDK